MTTWGAIRVSLGVIAVVLGTILMLTALPAAVTAAAIESSVGRTGVVAQPLGTLQAAPDDRAVVVDDVRARLIAPEQPPWVDQWLAVAGTSAQQLTERVGTLSLVAAMSTDAAGFLGVAPVDSVNSYLDAVPYSVAVQPADGEGTWSTVSVPGSRIPAAPQTQGLWSAQAGGTNPEIPASMLDSGTLVLMRADSEPAPEAALRLEYRVPGAGVALQSAAVSAAAASLGGLALIVLGGFLVVGRRRSA